MVLNDRFRKFGCAQLINRGWKECTGIFIPKLNNWHYLALRIMWTNQSPFFSLFISVCLSVSICLSLYLCLCVCLSVSVCHCLFVFLSLSLFTEECPGVYWFIFQGFWTFSIKFNVTWGDKKSLLFWSPEVIQ